MTSSETYDVPDERMLDRSIAAADFIGPEVHDPLPTRARVVVVGGGVVGAATAAHLAEQGERDVLLLERHRVASGSSWHAAGLLARVRGSHALTELATYSLETYRTLEARTGLPVAFNQNGSLTFARQPGRVDELLNTAGIARHHDVDARLLTPDEIAAVHPLTSPRRRAGRPPPTRRRHGQPGLVGRRTDVVGAPGGRRGTRGGPRPRARRGGVGRVPSRHGGHHRPGGGRGRAGGALLRTVDA